ncbi:thiol protease/hemagglutinin PrtT [Roseimarinus sediminis]|uniref:thiol protease/hemagglutinin PrtT n=1 Tax=Roseimarinus sediminis TaxID=1610899 RepID=UPI003D21AD91
MKIKCFLILLWLLPIVLPVWGAGISEGDARKVAVNWLNSQGLGVSEYQIAHLQSHTENKQALFYLVSFDPEAWVLVAGIDALQPVLAYGLKGSFQLENTPAEVGAWIEGLESEIREAGQPGYEPSPEVTSLWTRYSTDDYRPLKSDNIDEAGPLLTTTWDQGPFYNELAPADPLANTGNGHVWIGCVATALAQVMKFWSFPQKGFGEHSYFHSKYGKLSADFAAANYVWGAMPDHPLTENAQIQQISYHLAVAVEMDFGPLGSGSYLEDAIPAMINHFGYSNAQYLPERYKWDEQSEWEQLLKDEIQRGRPFIYAGNSPSGSNGHAFVCDGYRDNYFHFNWGWGGNYNGYYLLSALNPGSSNYTREQSALLGIEPVYSPISAMPLAAGFETGSSNGFSLSGVAEVNNEVSHSGAYSMLLSKPGFSSYSKNTATLTFTVPENGLLSFWVKRTTAELSTKNNQQAAVYSQYGNELLTTIFNGSFSDEAWQQYRVSLAQYSGKVVRLQFSQQNYDFYDEQWMFIDDVSISNSKQNIEPHVPGNPLPADDTTRISIHPLLSWTGGDPDGDQLIYSIYVGKDDSLKLMGTTTENSFQLHGLDPYTSYKWQVVSSDAYKSSTGPVWSFSTKGLPPEVEVGDVQVLSSSEANVYGQLINSQGKVVSERGFVLSKSTHAADSVIIVDSDSLLFSASLQKLSAYTTYEVKAWATTEEGTGYSEPFTFRTLPAQPVLALTEVRSVFRTGADIKGHLEALNDSAVTRTGVVWSTDSLLDFALWRPFEVSENLRDTGYFEIEVRGLPGPDTIWYSLFAANSAGLAYTPVQRLITVNAAPLVNLDQDNSSGALANDFIGTVSEQLFDGFLADSDVLIEDADGDTLKSIQIWIVDKLENQDEFLVFADSLSSALVSGNYSDTLLVDFNERQSADELRDLFQHLYYFVNSDAPETSTLRKVAIRVSDGFEYSDTAMVLLKVESINDAPLNTEEPKLTGAAVYGETLFAATGSWSDSLDACNADWSYAFQWQVKDLNEEISELGVTDSLLLLNADTLCGKAVRAKVIISDQGCGHELAVESSAFTEWQTIERAGQQIVFDQTDSLAYSKQPYVLQGIANSGLPLVYETTTDNVRVAGDSLYTLGTGQAGLLALQTGNACYQPAEPLASEFVVVKGRQEILLVAIDSLYPYASEPAAFEVKSTAGLEVLVSSSDTGIVKIDGSYLRPVNAGQCTLLFEQPGDENFLAASPVEWHVSVVKADQLISVADSIHKTFGDDAFFPEFEINSELKPEIKIENENIASYDAEQGISIHGAGSTNVYLSQEGNSNWNQGNASFVLHVSKAVQLIECLAPDSLALDSVLTISDFSATSGLPLSELLVVEGEGVLARGDSLIFTLPGRVVILAKHGGNENYLAGEQRFEFYIYQSTKVEVLPDLSFELYPNPAGEWVHVVLGHDFGTVDLQVFDVYRRLITSCVLSKHNEQIKVDGWLPGVYFFVFGYQQQQITRRLLVK